MAIEPCWNCNPLAAREGDPECTHCFGSGYLATGLFSGVKRVVRDKDSGELVERWGE